MFTSKKVPRCCAVLLRRSSHASSCNDTEAKLHKVFTCAGIEDAALAMRRCTQAAIGLEIVGSQAAKLLFHHGDVGLHTLAEQDMVMNNFVMLLHCGAMWWYQGFTRDHILARHVTSISLEKRYEHVNDGETLMAYVETRPWTHRLEMRARTRHDAVPLGKLAELGAIHIDKRRGDVQDQKALDFILADDTEIIAERISLDDSAKAVASVGNYEVTDFLQEDPSGTYEWLGSLPPLIKRPLQVDGRYAFWNFCFLAPAMAIGSVLLFLPEGTLPKPSFMKPKPSRNFEW
eukprot:TRINITY_DN75048_c0_g1_i1.p1 TRINITY_DN75048_c0_g1~~TRINITY_DN75048_c0_g1_i1.p1  ORF type:complete len:289 (-),score=26.03 TRINITY_DN75048_c0_g1_i1:176-1042(-)